MHIEAEFKRLITWLYERYCEPKELTGAELIAARATYTNAKVMHHAFSSAAYMGLPKPVMMQDSNQKTPERHQLWVEIYERELAKPHFVCINPKIERETQHRHAADRADIEMLYMKDAK